MREADEPGAHEEPATVPRRRHAARLLARRRSTAGVAGAGALGAPRLPARRSRHAAACLLQLRVDLLVDVGEPAVQILRLARLPLGEEALERLQVGGAGRR